MIKSPLIILFLFFSIFILTSCDNNSTQSYDSDSNLTDNFLTPQKSYSKALFAYSEKDSHFIVRQIDSEPGLILTRGEWENSYKTVILMHENNNSYLLRVKKDSPYKYYVQKLYSSGDLGNITDSGEWNNYYETLIPLKKNDNLFLFRQEKSDKNQWYINKITNNGKLLSHSDKGSWNHFYNSSTKLHINNHSCFFAQSDDEDKHSGVISDGYHWTLQCISDQGKIAKKDSGNWEHYYPTIVSFEIASDTYIFRQRPKFASDDPWYINPISDEATLKNHIDSGSWDEYFETAVSYRSDNKNYLFSHNKDNHFRIHILNNNATMGRITKTEYFSRFYNSASAFNIENKYLKLSHWMGDLYETIKNRKLSQITLPGSHDAGMNEDDKHNCFVGSSCNTITQSGDIAHQLKRGSRYFDIRPALNENSKGDSWSTAHTGVQSSHMLGCEGESRSSIIDTVNKFFQESQNSRELIILNISHCGMQPGEKEGKCSKSQLNTLAKNLANSINATVTCKDCTLSKMTLEDILEKGNVILLFHGDVDRNKTKGIFKSSSNDLNIYDSYANKESLSEMKDDQISKLLSKKNHEKDMFLLSWTLTLDTSSAKTCLVSNNSIIKQAMKVNPYLYREMDSLYTDKKLTKELFANILYVDVFNGEATRSAIYLNQIYDELKN
jgi:hypothetical protein